MSRQIWPLWKLTLKVLLPQLRRQKTMRVKMVKIKMLGLMKVKIIITLTTTI